MVSFCGFNAFKQILATANFLNNECEDKSLNTELSYHSVNQFISLYLNYQTWKSRGSNLVPSWSFCMLFNSGDSDLWFCGYACGRENAHHQVLLPNNLKIKQASCNQKLVICVVEDGSCWRYNIDCEQWTNLTPILQTEQSRGKDKSCKIEVVKVSCGETLTAVLTKSGEVFNVPNKLDIPRRVKIVDITCGRSHILLLSEEGQVFTVGEGSRGQLGHGELADAEEPRLVDALAGLPVTGVACGGWHSCAVTAAGDLYTWGWNQSGQLGLFDKGHRVSVQAVPLVVDWPAGMEVRVSKVACGSRHTITLLGDGSVWGCGWNGYGQLALPLTDEHVERMTKLPSNPDCRVQDIICGPWNSCLIFGEETSSLCFKPEKQEKKNTLYSKIFDILH